MWIRKKETLWGKRSLKVLLLCYFHFHDVRIIYFCVTGMEWDNLHLKAGPVVDIQPSLDSNLLFSEKDVKAVVSALFDQY